MKKRLAKKRVNQWRKLFCGARYNPKGITFDGKSDSVDCSQPSDKEKVM